MPSFDMGTLQDDIIAFLTYPSPPNAFVRVCIGLFVVAACFILLPVKKSFFEQCAAAIFNTPFRVFLNGLVVSFMLFFLAFIFLLSVIGFPVAVFFVMCGAVLYIMGEIAAGIWIGHFFTEKLNISRNAYSNLAFGVIIIEAAKMLPYAGLLLGVAVLPALCVGAASTGVYNAFVKRTLYELPYWREDNG